jgi:hypothetical protein
MLLLATAVAWVQALIWPLIFVLLLLPFAVTKRGRRFVGLVGQRVTKLSAFGISFELTPTAAQGTQQALESTFAELRPRVNRECDSKVRKYEIDERFATVAQVACDAARSSGHAVSQFRATLYVEDPLISGRLIQLLDYYPEPSGPRGRTFSIRFGLVGLAWRSGDMHVVGHVATNDPPSLIEGWGMTRREAEQAGQGRPSFLGLPIKVDGYILAIFYADAFGEDAFGADATDQRASHIRRSIQQAIDATKLDTELAGAMREVKMNTPNVVL